MFSFIITGKQRGLSTLWMDRVYGDFRPKGAKRDKDGCAVQGKRGSLIKFPKGEAEVCKF